MTPASRLKVQPGERVLDLCAAPGGKATELGAALQGEGLLVANDINTARAKALLRNLELFGISNSFVTNEPPHVLAERFPEFFHKIMVDAPCSGEGHFMALLHKKSGAEQEIKSDEQDSVMQNINYLQAENSKESGLNRTFHMNQEANTSEILNRDKKENTIKYQQDAEPVFDRKNIEISQKSDEKASKKSKKAKKKQQTETLSSVWWEKCKSLSKEQKAAAEDFFAHVNIAYDVGRIDVRGDNLYYLPEPQYDGRGLHFLRNGLFMGEFKKKRFEPSQPFALALRAQDFDQVLDFPADDERLQRYLRGETLDVSDLINGEKKRKGWQLVMAAGHPLGFGKLVNNNLKNKYPAGWRK